MLISHRHRFIFVHVPKNAGISIGEALAPFGDVPPRTPFRRALSKLPVPENPHKASFGLHASARWAKMKLPAEVFDGYLKFAVIRNPYDRAVSLYHFLTQKESHHRHATVKDMTFHRFLEHVGEKHWRHDETQLRCVGDRSGRILLDRILRFETLDRDFAALAAELGLPGAPRLPRSNTSEHGAHTEYLDDPKTRALLERLFAVDFEAFGYARDPAQHEAAGPARSDGSKSLDYNLA